MFFLPIMSHKFMAKLWVHSLAGPAPEGDPLMAPPTAGGEEVAGLPPDEQALEAAWNLLTNALGGGRRAKV